MNKSLLITAITRKIKKLYRKNQVKYYYFIYKRLKLSLKSQRGHRLILKLIYDNAFKDGS